MIYLKREKGVTKYRRIRDKIFREDANIEPLNYVY